MTTRSHFFAETKDMLLTLPQVEITEHACGPRLHCIVPKGTAWHARIIRHEEQWIAFLQTEHTREVKLGIFKSYAEAREALIGHIKPRSCEP